jgi:hypothetical protein
LLVRTERILWTDFYLVAAFLLFHPKLEHSISQLYERLSGRHLRGARSHSSRGGRR